MAKFKPKTQQQHINPEKVGKVQIEATRRPVHGRKGAAERGAAAAERAAGEGPGAVQGLAEEWAAAAAAERRRLGAAVPGARAADPGARQWRAAAGRGPDLREVSGPSALSDGGFFIICRAIF